LGASAGSGDSTRRRALGSSDCNIFPTMAAPAHGLLRKPPTVKKGNVMALRD
jgi:hypothetical protein